MTFFTFSIGWQFIVGLPQKHIHQLPIFAPDGFKWIQCFLFPPAPKGSASQRVQQISNKVRFCKHTCLHLLNGQDNMGRLRSWGLLNPVRKSDNVFPIFCASVWKYDLTNNITLRWWQKESYLPHWPNATYVGWNATSELAHHLWTRLLCCLSIDWGCEISRQNIKIWMAEII